MVLCDPAVTYMDLNSGLHCCPEEPVWLVKQHQTTVWQALQRAAKNKQWYKTDTCLQRQNTSSLDPAPYSLLSDHNPTPLCHRPYCHFMNCKASDWTSELSTYVNKPPMMLQRNLGIQFFLFKLYFILWWNWTSKLIRLWDLSYYHHQDKHIKTSFLIKWSNRKARMRPTQKPLEGISPQRVICDALKSNIFAKQNVSCIVKV